MRAVRRNGRVVCLEGLWVKDGQTVAFATIAAVEADPLNRLGEICPNFEGDEE